MLSRNAFSAVISTVLFETDSPELVLVKDTFDSYYLCSLVEVQNDNLLYLAIQISSDRLAAFREGRIDLRTALIEPEILPHFTGRFDLDAAKPTLRLEALDSIDPDWLPDSGFLLSNFSSASNEEVVTESIRRNAAVVTYRLNPPESRGTVARINADRLADWLERIQLLVSHATRLALKQLKTSKSRMAQFGSRPAVLQVYGFSPGSFTVHLASEESADLVGLTPVGAGLKKIDELMALVQLSPDEAYRKLEGNSGHVLTAFESLLELVATQESPLEYRWAEPAMGHGSGYRISPVAAKSMVSVLNTTAALKTEPVTFTGHFTSVNTDSSPFTWKAIDVDGHKRRGRVHDAVPDALNGVTIRDVRYMFSCEERLERQASGKTKPTLYLKQASKL